MTTVADYRRIFGDRYTDEQLAALRQRLRTVARVVVDRYRQEVATKREKPK